MNIVFQHRARGDAPASSRTSGTLCALSHDVEHRTRGGPTRERLWRYSIRHLTALWDHCRRDKALCQEVFSPIVREERIFTDEPPPVQNRSWSAARDVAAAEDWWVCGWEQPYHAMSDCWHEDCIINKVSRLYQCILWKEGMPGDKKRWFLSVISHLFSDWGWKKISITAA